MQLKTMEEEEEEEEREKKRRRWKGEKKRKMERVGENRSMCVGRYGQVREWHRKYI